MIETKAGVANRWWLLVPSIVGLTLLVLAVRPWAATSADARGPCALSSQVVDVDGDLTVHLVYPSAATCGGSLRAPYPAIAFAHGFSMFGLSNGAQDNLGNGEHLASWGYVVAIPVLPDDWQERLTAMGRVLSYLEAEAGVEDSFLYQKVDTGRLAAAGHSLGGATALALARQDVRIRAVVALDPVYHTGGPGGGEELWDPAEQGPQIVVPTGILGAPESSCNADADYARIYPWVGAMHKASFMLVGGSHCDFSDPGNVFCGIVCGSPDPARTELGKKYMTAWFNYYLYLDTTSYDLLYGAAGDADVSEGRIERNAHTAPRDLAAADGPAIRSSWTPYEHPIVAGYHIYRRRPGEPYAGPPIARVGRIGAYLDTGVVAGQLYSYTVRSHDPAGNLHQAADEVSALAREHETPNNRLYLALILR